MPYTLQASTNKAAAEDRPEERVLKVSGICLNLSLGDSGRGSTRGEGTESLFRCGYAEIIRRAAEDRPEERVLKDLYFIVYLRAANAAEDRPEERVLKDMNVIGRRSIGEVAAEDRPEERVLKVMFRRKLTRYIPERQRIDPRRGY